MSRRDSFPQTFTDAHTYLLAGRSTSGRPLCNNTRVERICADAIAIRLHSTNIVTFYRDGSIQLETGGWNTVTTRERMNRALSERWRVGTERGTLYLYGAGPAGSFWDETATRYAWARPMRLYPDGTTSAPVARKRTHRPHVNPECGCAACTAQRGAGQWRTRWSDARGQYLAPTVTPDDTVSEAGTDDVLVQPDGITGERWADYNRKMNDLLMGRTA